MELIDKQYTKYPHMKVPSVTIKYEKIYLNVYEDGQALFLGIIEYMNYYNPQRY